MRILVVEDDKKIAAAIKKGLERERFAVDVSWDGRDGLGQALTIEYDLVILDRMLPETDGLAICRVLREKGIKAPVLILTAKDRISDKVEGLNAGADDYLVKPFSFSELVARVRALLRRPRDVGGDTLSVRDLVLDMRTFEVRRKGRHIKLSAKEFALLEYLARNAGRVLSKDSIITHVWDYDADILPNTVEVYIGYLRDKIDRSFPKGRPLIKTVRGFGYKIEV